MSKKIKIDFFCHLFIKKILKILKKTKKMNKNDKNQFKYNFKFEIQEDEMKFGEFALEEFNAQLKKEKQIKDNYKDLSSDDYYTSLNVSIPNLEQNMTILKLNNTKFKNIHWDKIIQLMNNYELDGIHFNGVKIPIDKKYKCIFQTFVKNKMKYLDISGVFDNAKTNGVISNILNDLYDYKLTYLKTTNCYIPKKILDHLAKTTSVQYHNNVDMKIFSHCIKNNELKIPYLYNNSTNNYYPLSFKNTFTIKYEGQIYSVNDILDSDNNWKLKLGKINVKGIWYEVDRYGKYDSGKSLEYYLKVYISNTTFEINDELKAKDLSYRSYLKNLKYFENVIIDNCTFENSQLIYPLIFDTYSRVQKLILINNTGITFDNIINIIKDKENKDKKINRKIIIEYRSTDGDYNIICSKE